MIAAVEYLRAADLEGQEGASFTFERAAGAMTVELAEIRKGKGWWSAVFRNGGTEGFVSECCAMRRPGVEPLPMLLTRITPSPRWDAGYAYYEAVFA